MTNPQRRRLTLAGAAVLSLLFQQARRTRPERLPLAPEGSIIVEARDGTRLHAQIGGNARAELTVVLVHGLLARTIEFDMQWVALADRARLVRYDHRNHGRSDRSRRQVSVDVLAEDLADVLEQLSPRGPVVLVGHSLGGMTILALARQRPEMFGPRIAGVGLLATRAGHYLPGHPVENTVRWAARHGLLGIPLAIVRACAPVLEQLRPRRSQPLRVATRRFLFGPDDADPATVAMVQQLLEEPPVSVLAGIGSSVLRHNALTSLGVLANVPVAIVGADHDHLAWDAHAHQIAADIGPSAELGLLPGVGHALNQTRPVEVNAALGRLIDRAIAHANRSHTPAAG